MTLRRVFMLDVCQPLEILKAFQVTTWDDE